MGGNVNRHAGLGATPSDGSEEAWIQSAITALQDYQQMVQDLSSGNKPYIGQADADNLLAGAAEAIACLEDAAGQGGVGVHLCATP